MLLLALCGAGYEAVAASMDARKYPPPGELVDVSGYRLHLHCMGQGGPTVILESGSGAPSPNWSLVQPEVAKFARACTYDRAGYGWSDPADTPRSGDQIVDDLHALLNKAKVDGPYILVGHSLGGMYARLYADRHPERVAGMVLIDARHEDFTAMEAQGGRSSLPGTATLITVSALARTGVVRALLSLGVGSQEIGRLPEAQRPGARAVLARPQLYSSVYEEFLGLPGVERDLRAVQPLGSKPLAVLVQGKRGTSAPSDENWMALQRKHAELSGNSRLIIAKQSGHNIQLDQPDLVVDAIRRVIAGRP